jgi:Protein of unknown function (DUF1740).
MESSLEQNPNDVKLWLSLARFHMKGQGKEAAVDVNDISGSKPMEKALSVLSQSLEANRDSEELWIEYLTLFAKNSSAEELRELSYQAVMYAATYNVWWTCLHLETDVHGKQEICTEMIKFVKDIEEGVDFKSHALLETLLYLCKLLQCRGLTKLAFHCLSAALGKSSVDDTNEKITIGDFTTFLNNTDLALLWVCFLSFKCHNYLPDNLYAAGESGPDRLVNKSKFLIDWNKALLVTEEEVRTLYQGQFYLFTK